MSSPPLTIPPPLPFLHADKLPPLPLPVSQTANDLAWRNWQNENYLSDDDYDSDNGSEVYYEQHTVKEEDQVIFFIFLIFI